MSRLDLTIDAKKEKRAALEKQGVAIHPASFEKKQTIAQCRESEGQTIQTAGRLMSLRPHGKVIFADLQDSTGKIQLLFHTDLIDEIGFEQLKSLIDPGDFLGVSGKVSTTKTGELTIKAESFTFLGKALRPIPSSWNAAENKETRFRKRYLDMLVNPKAKQVLDARWLIEKEIRRFLQDEQNYTEVETPILQSLYGGTNAKPFTTHMNALDCDFYLRVAPELYLKRLIVGGYERIFEIARNFRNEGIDQTHQPEFTMIEWYEAYADYNRVMDVTEGLFKHLAEKLNGSNKLMVGEAEIDIGNTWPRLTMLEAVQKYLGFDFEKTSNEDLQKKMAEEKIELIGEFTRGKALFAIFDKLVTPQLIEATWIIDYPRDVSPLAKKHRLQPEYAERFEGYIAGKEICDGWSEITDPIDQRQIFENEQKRMRSGDDEAHPLDEDFLEAMEYGMPPLGGIGVGIDRLVMFLTNTWSIKEVIAFPTLRPEKKIKSQKPKITKNSKPQNSNQKSAKLPQRNKAEELLDQYIKNDALKHHCRMVATAMQAYARELGEDEELWYQTGLLHDLDWEKYPDEHPNKAVNEILTDYPEVLLQAIRAHAPDRTGVNPSSTLDKYLFACDELSGFMHAVSLMRPNGFADMKVKSVKKKLKDKSFAAAVPREDMELGAELIKKELTDHIAFLIEVFNNAGSEKS